jgi:hypothetical protein
MNKPRTTKTLKNYDSALGDKLVLLETKDNSTGEKKYRLLYVSAQGERVIKRSISKKSAIAYFYAVRLGMSRDAQAIG